MLRLNTVSECIASAAAVLALTIPRDANAQVFPQNNLSVDTHFESSPYAFLSHSGDERNFRPGALLVGSVGGSYRLGRFRNDSEGGPSLSGWSRFRYLQRWQLGLDSFPMELASYIFDAGAEFAFHLPTLTETRHTARLRLGIQHHSNGAGQHCTLGADTWALLGRESCSVSGDPSIFLNRELGDYTSNRYGASFLWQIDRRENSPWSLIVGASAEFQCVGSECLGFENLTEGQAALFGAARFQLFAQGQIVWGPRVLRGEIGGEYHTGTDGRVPTGRFWLETMLQWPHVYGAGIVVRVNGGRDFMHMFAVDDVWSASLGIMMDTSLFSQWMSAIR
ncbi:MAG: hypothetical protein IPJ69_08635 [Deltaproteobacteria bacterium]|nr:MAG: hypothetical protein IPJ69_08635 [Deltaproteobacteria bacterium]